MLLVHKKSRVGSPSFKRARALPFGTVACIPLSLGCPVVYFARKRFTGEETRGGVKLSPGEFVRLYKPNYILADTGVPFLDGDPAAAGKKVGEEGPYVLIQAGRGPEAA